MTFHIITLFPEAVRPYLESSIVGRAKKKGLVKIKYYNPLDFTKSKHRRVDDRPYGGGPGMVMQIEPLLRAVQSAKSRLKIQDSKLIIFSPAGKQFTGASARRLAKSKDILLICGRYEGIDTRLKKIITENWELKIEELSIGPYVLTGGELPAMVVIDSVSRQIKGVLGKQESLEEGRLGIGVPVYTRPEEFVYRGKKYKVPKALVSGNHAEIAAWRKKHKKTLPR